MLSRHAEGSYSIGPSCEGTGAIATLAKAIDSRIRLAVFGRSVMAVAPL